MAGLGSFGRRACAGHFLRWDRRRSNLCWPQIAGQTGNTGGANEGGPHSLEGKLPSSTPHNC